MEKGLIRLVVICVVRNFLHDMYSQSRLWSDCVDAQSHLILCWSLLTSMESIILELIAQTLICFGLCEKWSRSVMAAHLQRQVCSWWGLMWQPLIIFFLCLSLNWLLILRGYQCWDINEIFWQCLENCGSVYFWNNRVKTESSCFHFILHLVSQIVGAWDGKGSGISVCYHHDEDESMQWLFLVTYTTTCV